MVKVNISQLLTIEDLQFVVNDNTLQITLYICCLVLFIGIVIVGLDIDIKFLHGDKKNCQT